MSHARLLSLTLLFGLLTSIIVLGIQSSSSASQYDPWTDVNGDGVIDISDAALLGLGWGATGDPTRDVNVMNWPMCNATTVWFRAPFNSTWLTSPTYHANGFGQMHILADVACLGTANATIILYSNIWDASHTNRLAVTSLMLPIVGTGIRYYSTTIPVPNDEFYFLAYTTPVANNAQLYLSFWLTWL